MTFWEVLCLVVYSIIIAVLGIYGFHRYQLLRLFYRHHPTPVPEPDRFAELPSVTIQLPLYNEYHVVEAPARGRWAEIDYPRDRLQIQVLDDSQDETRDKAREGVGAAGRPKGWISSTSAAPTATALRPGHWLRG